MKLRIGEIALLCSLLLFFTGCVFLPQPDPLLFTKTRDIDPFVVKFFKTNGLFYKLDSKYSVDYMVLFVRIGAFSKPSLHNFGEIFFTVGLAGKEKAFDCSAF